MAKKKGIGNFLDYLLPGKLVDMTTGDGTVQSDATQPRIPMELWQTQQFKDFLNSPGVQGSGGLGLGLKRHRQQLFRQAASAGTLSELLNNDPRFAEAKLRFVEALKQPENSRVGRVARLWLQMNEGMKPGNAKTPVTPETATPPPEQPQPTPDEILRARDQQLGPLMAPAAQGTEAGGPFATYLQGAYSRLNAVPTPSYQDMFQRWMDVSNREAGRQAANLTEAFGSRGARYGSDILRAQGDLRQKQTQDLASMADQIGMNLNNARIGEAGQLATGTLGLAGLDAQRNSDAMNRLWLAYMRGTQLPPGLQTSAGYAQNPGGQPSVAMF